jgi:hypothetical protein
LAGPFHTFQGFAWCDVKSGRKRQLSQHGMNRPLDRTDIPKMLEKAIPNSMGKNVNNAALKNIGLMPFNRAKLEDARVKKTRGEEPNEACKPHLSVNDIKYHVDAGQLEEASAKLLEQLGGKKFGSGKFWRYCSTKPTGTCGVASALPWPLTSTTHNTQALRCIGHTITTSRRKRTRRPRPPSPPHRGKWRRRQRKSKPMPRRSGKENSRQWTRLRSAASSAHSRRHCHRARPSTPKCSWHWPRSCRRTF